jgi:hypothetical protein
MVGLPETSVTLRVSTQADLVPLSSFLEAVENFQAILAEIDAELSGRPGGTLSWNISGLSLGSAVITATPESTDPDIDMGPQVVSTVVRGLESLEHAPERPPYFSDEAVHRARQLVGLIQPKTRISRITVVAPPMPIVTITQQTAAHIDKMVGAGYTALGSVEGRLEAISVHGKPSFGVYDFIEGRRINCEFSPGMLKQVKDALGGRVLVSGRVRFNESDKPTSVREIQEFIVLRSRDDLPQPRDIVGIAPDITGDVDSVEHLRRLNDDD